MAPSEPPNSDATECQTREPASGTPGVSRHLVCLQGSRPDGHQDSRLGRAVTMTVVSTVSAADKSQEQVDTTFSAQLEQLKDRHIDYQLQDDPLAYYTEKVGDVAQRANLSPRLFNWVEIDPERDVLLVIDMQKDFVNTDDLNTPSGCGSEKACGRFSCPGATKASRVIENLIDQFSSAGATIIASKDYHPRDHASFKRFAMPILGQGEHCVWGTPGSKLYEPLRRKMEEARMRPNSHVDVVFKGMAKDIDSFGAFKYAESHANKRQLERTQHLTEDDDLETFAFNDGFSSGKVQTENLEWTGSWRVPTCSKDSGAYRREFDEYRYDIDAYPPLNTEQEWEDVVQHEPNTLENVILEHLNEIRNGQPHDYTMTGCEVDPSEGLRWKEDSPSLTGGSKKGIRIFVTGVALDFCVIDTTINSLHSFDVPVESYLVWDAARPVNLFNTGKALFSAYGAVLAHEATGITKDKQAVQSFLSGLLLNQDKSFAGSPKTVRNLLEKYTQPDSARENVLRLLRKDQIVSAPDALSDFVHTPWFNYLDKFRGMAKSKMSFLPFADDKAERSQSLLEDIGKCYIDEGRNAAKPGSEVIEKLLKMDRAQQDTAMADMSDTDWDRERDLSTLQQRIELSKMNTGHRLYSRVEDGDPTDPTMSNRPNSDYDRFDPILGEPNQADRMSMLGKLSPDERRDIVGFADSQGVTHQFHGDFQSAFGSDYATTLRAPDGGHDPSSIGNEDIYREEIELIQTGGGVYDPYKDPEKGIAAARTRFLLTRYKEMCNHLEETFHQCMSRNTIGGIHPQAGHTSFGRDRSRLALPRQRQSGRSRRKHRGRPSLRRDGPMKHQRRVEGSVHTEGPLGGTYKDAEDKCACPRCYGDLVTRNLQKFLQVATKEGTFEEVTAAQEILDFYELAKNGRVQLSKTKEDFDLWATMFKCINDFDAAECDKLSSGMGSLLTPPMPRSVRQMLFWSTPAGKEKASEIARTGDFAYMLEGKTSFGVFFDGLSGHEMRSLYPVSYREKGPWSYEMVSNMWGKAFSKAYGDSVKQLLEVAKESDSCDHAVYLDLFVSTFRDGSAFHGTELPTVFRAYYELWQKAVDDEDTTAVDNLKNQVKFNIFFDAQCEAKKYLKDKACKMFIEDNKDKKCGIQGKTVGQIWDEYKDSEGVHLNDRDVAKEMFNTIEGGAVLEDTWTNQYRPVLDLNDRFDILNACQNNFKCGSDIKDKDYLMEYVASSHQCHCSWNDMKDFITGDMTCKKNQEEIQDLCLAHRLGGDKKLVTYKQALAHFKDTVVDFFYGADSFTTFKADVDRNEIKSGLKYDSQARIKFCQKYGHKMDDGDEFDDSDEKDDGDESDDAADTTAPVVVDPKVAPTDVEGGVPSVTNTEVDSKAASNGVKGGNDSGEPSAAAAPVSTKEMDVGTEEKEAELEARKIESSEAVDLAERVRRLRTDSGIRR